MSLTTNDLDEIRNIVESALTRQTNEVIKPIQGELEALRNDIKDIYDMLAAIQKTIGSRKSFEKLSLEEKILKLHSELVEAATHAGVTLPRH